MIRRRFNRTPRITIDTPNTAILSIYHDGSKTACIGKVRRIDGVLTDNCLEITGAGIWETVRNALDELNMLKMQNLLMLCNDAHHASIFQYPICIPQPGREQHKIGRDREAPTVSIPTGGCNHMWHIIRNTSHYKKWRMVHYEHMLTTKELLK